VIAVADSAAEAAPVEETKKPPSSRTRQLLMYALHATIGTAALIAYAWYF